MTEKEELTLLKRERIKMLRLIDDAYILIATGRGNPKKVVWREKYKELTGKERP